MVPIVNRSIEKYGQQIYFRILDVDIDANKVEMEKYQVSAIPYFVLLDKDGEIIDKRIGSLSQDDFFKFIEQVTE